MTKNLEKCMDKLKFISSVKSDSLRKKLLESFSDECMYKALNEISIALNKGTLDNKLSPNQKKIINLKKNKRILKNLTKTKQTKSIKKKLIIQSGGFLPYIIPAVASIITSLIK